MRQEGKRKFDLQKDVKKTVNKSYETNKRLKTHIARTGKKSKLLSNTERAIIVIKKGKETGKRSL